jgi:hypothetical protein
MTKQLTILALALAAATPFAAAAAACGDSPNAENLVLTAGVRTDLSHAFANSTGMTAAALPGRTYYGNHVGIRYAVATFAVPGRTYPAIFSDQGRGRWKLLRITHGGICSGVVPVDMIQAWALAHWRGGCYVEPAL